MWLNYVTNTAFTTEKMASRELPEVRMVSKTKLMEKELKENASRQDKKSSVRQRQIDRSIYLTSKELNDIQTCTSSPARKRPTPQITVTASNDNSYDSDHVCSPRAVNSSDCDSDSDTHLVHLRARTRRNMLLSQKLSRSLEVMNERRVHSPWPPLSASKERRPYRPVSSRSMEDLQRAATVLRFTEHEEEIQQLLSSVSLKASQGKT